MAQRTTLTLEDDVFERVRNEARRSGKPLKAVVNDAIRAGLAQNEDLKRQPFKVRARRMGLRPGVNVDDISGLLEQLEGPLHP